MAGDAMTPAEVCLANAETWAAFMRFVDAIVDAPVRYGPGRGLWVGGKFMIGYAPGARSKLADLKTWPNQLNKLYPALHCTSFTNLFLSWIDRRNELFTHGGNVPDLMELLGADSTLHVYPNRCSYRGFKGAVTAITPDGSGMARAQFKKFPVVDVRELLARARAGGLPTFVVFSQSTKRDGSWNTDHHTGLYVVWEGKLYRIAADGMVAGGKYTSNAMQWLEITDTNVSLFGAAVYRVWGVDTADGSYGDPSKPIAELDFEAL